MLHIDNMHAQTSANPAAGESTGYDYGRVSNPARNQLEKVVASLEGGIDALAFSSGMAAITLLIETFNPGDHIIADADLYGGAIRLFDNVSKRNGIDVTYVLSYAPSKYETMDILKVVEGNITAVDANEKESADDSAETYVCNRLWNELDVSINNVLNRLTLADLLEWEKEKTETNIESLWI